MRDRRRGAGGTIDATDVAIEDAKRWSDHLLGQAFRGPGDTIERASFEVEQKWGVPASIIQRLRHRDVRDMLLSNWLALQRAYHAACEATERAADHQKHLAEKAGSNAANSRAFAAASLLDRQEEQALKGDD